jgi:hypothetical protein
MGIVGRPDDLVRGRRRLIEKGLQDLRPEIRDSVLEILQGWEGKSSEDRLTNLIGEEKTRHLIKSLRKR